MSAVVRTVADTATVCTALVVATGWLQAAVAVSTIIWLAIRISETRRFIRWRCKASKGCHLECRVGCQRFQR